MLLAAPSSWAAEEITGTPGTMKYRAKVNFRQMAEFAANSPLTNRPPKQAPVLPRQYTTNDAPEEAGPMGAPVQAEGSRSAQALTALAQSPSPASSFPALDQPAPYIFLYPPHPSGAVGPNHIVTAADSQLKIQDRQGSDLSVVDLDTFWTPVGFPGAIMPKVVYDPYDNRWTIAAVSAPSQFTNFFFFSSILLAVSETSDPTGNWIMYRQFVDNQFLSTFFALDPNLGFNKQWMVLSVNLYDSFGTFFQAPSGVQIYAFDKAGLYTNGLAPYTLLTLPGTAAYSMVPQVTYDPNYPDLHFVEVDNFLFNQSGFSSRLRISTLTGAPGQELLRVGNAFTTNSLNWLTQERFGFIGGSAPQLGTFVHIMNNDSRIQNVVYRNDSLWCTHSVFTADRTGVQWWQLGVTPTNAITHQIGRIEDTNNINFYAFPSLAVNRCGDVLIGYSSFSSNTFASASYSFRFGDDPPNTLHPPTLLKAGEGPYDRTQGISFFANPWGEYSSSVVDPANDLDMWTLQEYAAGQDPSIGIDRWGLWWGRVDVANITHCGQVEFATRTFSVNEGASSVATITITNLTGLAGSVDYMTSDGTAREGFDYRFQIGTAVFAAGQKSAIFTVDILDDGLVNSNRTVNLSLFNPSGAVTIGGISNAVLTIIDDEYVQPPNIAGEFNFSTYFNTNTIIISGLGTFLQSNPFYIITENESGGFGCGQVRGVILPVHHALGAIVTVMRTGNTRGKVLVDFATAEGGTAIPGQDYFPTNMTLAFDDFQTSTNILIPVFSNFGLLSDGHKMIRLVLSNPRPAPDEELELPGQLFPTLGPGSESAIMVLEINQGYNPFFFGGGGFVFTNRPAFAFERANWRVNEYSDNGRSPAGGIRRVNIDVIFPFGVDSRAGSVIFRTSDPRVGVILLNPYTQPGSDIAEAYGEPDDPDPFSGFETWANPAYTDPALSQITNYTDYFSTNTVLQFADDECRKTLTLYITNDATVEFNEDIVLRLVGIRGEMFQPNPWMAQATLTIMFHDEPAGALDREWNPDNISQTDPSFNLTPGANNIVYAVAVQPDGKTLLAGEFTAVNSQPRKRVARLNLDGTVDTTFEPGEAANRFISGMVLYPPTSVHAGKVLVCGDFTTWNNGTIQRKGVARLNSNGTLDTSFNPGAGANGPVFAMALQADGKVVVGGYFSEFNSVLRNNIARLLPDGGLDTTFNAVPGPDNVIRAVTIVPQAVGPERILIGGDFFTVNDQFNFHIAQLNDNGSSDLTFNSGSGADSTVYTLLVQPDGRILVGGDFNFFNDTFRSKIARLLPSGTLDPSFAPPYGANDSVLSLALQADGKIFIGGAFTSYDNTRRMSLARLRPDSTLDTSFLDTAYNQFAGFTHPSLYAYASPNLVNAIALQPDGNVMVGGSFTNVGGNPSTRHALRERHTVFTRADKRVRFNIARLIGGVTHGPGNAQFDQENYFVDENAGVASLRMQRTDGRLGTLLGLGVTEDRFATPDVDYLNATNARAWIERWDELPMPYSIGDVRSVFFRVPLLDDPTEEGDEVINLRFLKAEGTLNLGGEIIPIGGALGRAVSTLTIVDNDFPRGEFNFQISNFVTNELASNGLATIVVIRTNGSSGAASVEYFTRPATNTPVAAGGTSCQPGIDFRHASGRLQFLSGQTTNFFVIPICNDATVEFDENIMLVLTNAAGGAKLPGGRANSSAIATLTIVDNDFEPGRINLGSTTFSNNEADGAAAVRVTRTGGNVGTVSVRYRMLSGTAQSPADYVSATQTLSWNDGDNDAKTIWIPLATDGLVEGTENFRVELFEPRVNTVADSRLLGNRTNSTVLIVDSDAYGTLAFNQPYFQADENGGSVTITVLRTAGSSETVTVNYGTSPDSAIPNLDYTTVNGTLTLVPGQSSATFSVPLLDDTSSDGNKVVRLQLSNPGNALLGNPAAVNLVLVDNESFNNPPGEIDTTFDRNAQANGPVYAVSLYVTNGVPDGRLMIAGDFTNVNNIVRQGLARLNANGTLDTSFNVGTGPNAPVRAMAIQADGKVLFGGFFSEVTGTNRNGIARLNIEGTLDTFFDPGSGADGPVYSIAVQADQKILVAGAFSDFDTQQLPGIVRLRHNGQVDTTFDAGAGPDGGVVFAIALQPDGKILIGGDFHAVDGVERPGLARLHPNGSVDTSFDVGTGMDLAVRAILIQPDGKIVIGGSFTTVNGVLRNSLARLERNGALDTAFMNSLSGANNSVQALALHADGKIVASGDFTRFHDVTRNHITRLNPDGTTDTTINFGTGANAFIAALAIQPDRRIVIGGAFTSYDNQARNRIARIYGGSVAGSGALEFLVQEFSVAETGTNGIVSVRRRGGTAGTVGVNFYTADDTALAGRDYVGTNAPLSFPPGEVLRQVPVRVLINPAPSADLRVLLNLTNYTGGAAIGSRPTAALMIRNEQALIGFLITNYVATEGIPSGLATIEVARLLSTNNTVSIDFATVGGGTAQPFGDYTPTNGTLVFFPGQITKTFSVPIREDAVIESAEQVNLRLSNPSPNTFLGVDTATLSILDNDFAPGQLFFATSAYFIDESGGLLELTILRTNGSRGVVSVDLVTSDGTATVGADYGFATRRLSLGEDETNGVFTVAILDDFVVEGNETFFVTMSNPGGGAILSGPTNAIVTIVENDFGPGNLIRDFDPGLGANNYVRAVAVQRDGKIVVGGAFTMFDNTSRNYLTRLNENGSQDLSFAIGTGANSLVTSLAMGTDGRIFLGGTFTSLNGMPFSRVGRLLTNGAPDANYNQVPGFNAVVHSLAVQSNGNLLVGGNFNLPARSLTQLRANGSIDNTFVVGSGADNLVHAVAIYPDGSAIAAGGFTNFNGVVRSRIVRLLPDGNLDLNFVPSAITNGIIYAVSIQPNGQILIGGDFHTSASRFSIARLNADGSFDSSFRGTNGINGIVFGLGLQSNGKIVIGGNFTTVDGISRNRYARLNTNGSLDETFNPGIGANNTVYSVCILPDDNILLGGEFTLVNGISRRGIAKIRGNDREARFYFISRVGNTARVSMTSTPGVNYILQASSNLVNWTSLSTNNASGDTLTLIDPAANLHNKRFYRVRQAGQ